MTNSAEETGETDTADRISRACNMICILWGPAEMVADKLATPQPDSHTGGRVSRGTAPDPINSTMVDQMDDISQFLVDAANTAGLPRDVAVDMALTQAANLAAWVGDAATVLASKPDRAYWLQQAVQGEQVLRRICRDTDYGTKWRAALVDWDPTHIAILLTDLTGHAVSGRTLRNAKTHGKITLAKGNRVILGEAATAIGL